MRIFMSALLAATLAAAVPAHAHGGHGRHGHGYHHGHHKHHHVHKHHYRHHRHHRRHHVARTEVNNYYYGYGAPVASYPPGVHVIFPDIFLPWP